MCLVFELPEVKEIEKWTKLPVKVINDSKNKYEILDIKVNDDRTENVEIEELPGRRKFKIKGGKVRNLGYRYQVENFGDYSISFNFKYKCLDCKFSIPDFPRPFLS